MMLYEVDANIYDADRNLNTGGSNCTHKVRYGVKEKSSFCCSDYFF